MKRFALLPNPMKDPDFSLSAGISQYLMDRGAELYTDECFRGISPENVQLLPQKELFEVADCMISIGGDGTLLQIAKPAAFAQKPILGINYGKIGYMAELEVNELNELDRLLTDDFQIEKRMMLRVEMVRDGKVVFSSIALNDAVLACGAVSRLIPFEVRADGQELSAYWADGVILSTPTGSTGYSLSAGGPVLQPTGNAMILTTICSHSIAVRPIVFAADTQIEVEVGSLMGKDANLTVDGYETIKAQEKDLLLISRAPQITRLVKIKNINFYKILNQKLIRGGGVK